MKTKEIPPTGDPGRLVVLSGQLDFESTLPAISQILSLANESNDPIVLQITSPGGCVSAGFALIDTMNHVAAPVFTVAVGSVASMGALLLINGCPGHRYALPHTRILLHHSRAGASGKLQEISSAVSVHRQIDRDLQALILSRTQIPRRQIRSLLGKEKFLSAKEAHDLGLIDHILL
jgi:ATP-dependent Clp protease protease subunit